MFSVLLVIGFILAVRFGMKNADTISKATGADDFFKWLDGEKDSF